MMRKITKTIFLFLLSPIALFAQSSESVYATMDAADALNFKKLYPNSIEIIASNELEAAVLLTAEATHKIHDNVLTHGPGYIFRASEAKAREALNPVVRRATVASFTITEDLLVNECLNLVNGTNIENDILELQNFGTRYHTKPQAEQAVLNQKAKWDLMIASSGRTDVHTRIVNHVNTPMPSVVLTIDGANTPSEFVIIGGHIDSTSWNNDDAPGADDNASGIASLNEIVRVLLAKQFVPNRTVEVMAYAAEEIGLIGSQEIASAYSNNGVNVLAYVQFDMTGYEGSNNDIYITTDWYNSSDLNTFLVDLMNHYNSSGPHGFTYAYTECGYKCSDHASWADYGYNAAFPFEAKMGEDNPNIHTPYDEYSFFNSPDHSVKFAKLGLEFVIEAAKPQTLEVNEVNLATMNVFVNDKILNYTMNNSASTLKKVSVYNIAGQKIFTDLLENQVGSLDLKQFAEGFYIAQFTLNNHQTLTKKFILR